MWFIGVEVEQETSAPTPKKNPGSAPEFYLQQSPTETNPVVPFKPYLSARVRKCNTCFGFIDGTVRAISRPGKDQRLVYNGHKRVHALKFQSVSLPNGIIASLFGPVGRSEFLLHTSAN